MYSRPKFYKILHLSHNYNFINAKEMNIPLTEALYFDIVSVIL